LFVTSRAALRERCVLHPQIATIESTRRRDCSSDTPQSRGNLPTHGLRAQGGPYVEDRALVRRTASDCDRVSVDDGHGGEARAVVEFGDKVRAKAVTAGGESGHPSSKHFNDEATRYANGALRDVYFYRDQLKGHIEREYHP